MSMEAHFNPLTTRLTRGGGWLSGRVTVWLALGLGMASLTILLVGYLIGRIEGAILPDFSLTVLEWSFLGLLPVFAGLVSMITARVTVLRSLTRMP